MASDRKEGSEIPISTQEDRNENLKLKNTYEQLLKDGKMGGVLRLFKTKASNRKWNILIYCFIVAIAIIGYYFLVWRWYMGYLWDIGLAPSLFWGPGADLTGIVTSEEFIEYMWNLRSNFNFAIWILFVLLDSSVMGIYRAIDPIRARYKPYDIWWLLVVHLSLIIVLFTYAIIHGTVSFAGSFTVILPLVVTWGVAGIVSLQVEPEGRIFLISLRLVKRLNINRRDIGYLINILVDSFEEYFPDMLFREKDDVFSKLAHSIIFNAPFQASNAIQKENEPKEIYALDIIEKLTTQDAFNKLHHLQTPKITGLKHDEYHRWFLGIMLALLEQSDYESRTLFKAIKRRSGSLIGFVASLATFIISLFG